MKGVVLHSEHEVRPAAVVFCQHVHHLSHLVVFVQQSRWGCCHLFSWFIFTVQVLFYLMRDQPVCIWFWCLHEKSKSIGPVHDGGLSTGTCHSMWQSTTRWSADI